MLFGGVKVYYATPELFIQTIQSVILKIYTCLIEKLWRKGVPLPSYSCFSFEEVGKQKNKSLEKTTWIFLFLSKDFTCLVKEHRDWSWGNFLGELPLRDGENLQRGVEVEGQFALSEKSVHMNTNTAMWNVVTEVFESEMGKHRSFRW